VCGVYHYLTRCLSLLPVVCRRAHVLLTLVVFVCVKWCPTHIVLFFYFVLLAPTKWRWRNIAKNIHMIARILPWSNLILWIFLANCPIFGSDDIRFVVRITDYRICFILKSRIPTIIGQVRYFNQFVTMFKSILAIIRSRA
jgi:hypothetical protein